MTGEKAGLVVMGYTYAGAVIESRADGLYLTEVTCARANKGGKEQTVAEVKIPDDGNLYLRAVVKNVGAKKPVQKSDYKCEVTLQ